MANAYMSARAIVARSSRAWAEPSASPSRLISRVPIAPAQYRPAYEAPLLAIRPGLGQRGGALRRPLREIARRRPLERPLAQLGMNRPLPAGAPRVRPVLAQLPGERVVGEAALERVLQLALQG